MTNKLETIEKPCTVQTQQGFSVLYRNRYLYSRYAPSAAVLKFIEGLTLLPDTLILCYAPALGYGLRELLQKMPPGCHILTVDFDKQLYEFFLENCDIARGGFTQNAVQNTTQNTAGVFGDISANLSIGVGIVSRESDAECAGCPSGASEHDARVSSVLLRNPAEIARILNDGKVVPPPGSFKRVVIVKMSGGTAFSEEAYTEVTEYADNFIQTFWKNHITLTRMGRMFALDVFRNLKAIEGAGGEAGRVSEDGARHGGTAYEGGEPDVGCGDATRTARNVRPLRRNSVSKPILVIGAGLSTDKLLPKLAAHRQHFFILCVDAALPSLLQHGIRPDAVVAVECQVAIEKAYIGAAESGLHVIADLTSRPRVTRLCAGEMSFFLSEYCTMPFMKELTDAARSLGIPVFPPLGSVGLYAVETALFLRKAGTPVFVCGLDFSFVPGQTHCKGAPAHTAAALTANRLKPVGFPGAAYNHTAHPIEGKQAVSASGRTEYTDAALSGYGALYAERYKNVPNLFDCAETGMKSAVPLIAVDAMFALAKEFCSSELRKNEVVAAPLAEKAEPDTAENSPVFAAPVAAQSECGYVAEQKKKLLRIKAILTGAEEQTSEKELEELIAECGYLYAHFPDCAAGFHMTQDFLNRIRAEVDVFLKAYQ